MRTPDTRFRKPLLYPSFAHGGKDGHPYPRCGTTISQVRANQRLTNFCRRCQS
ncbi:MAG: hypothetical protein HY664_03310 [Chloroflexi bacterium]|nr:hypothetical protein [Chloroflexota bacterium]